MAPPGVDHNLTKVTRLGAVRVTRGQSTIPPHLWRASGGVMRGPGRWCQRATRWPC